MNEIEVCSWQHINDFSASDAAALIHGLSPQQGFVIGTKGTLELMRNAYKNAVYLHKEEINETYDENIYGPKEDRDFKELNKKSLRSNELIQKLAFDRVDYEEGHGSHLYTWLCGAFEIGEPAYFEVQKFSRDEISRWLKVNNIKSVFPFGITDQAMPIGNAELNHLETRTATNANLKGAHPLVANQPTHDSLPLDGIARVFSIDSDQTENLRIWRSFAKEAVRNGLDATRTLIGIGTAQSKFDPVGVGEWLVKKGRMEQAKVDRLLNNNLPKRSAHLKDL